MAMLMSVMSFAETELFTQTYPGSPSTYTSAYTKSFTLTTGDYTLTYTNVNNGQATGTGYPWTIIRTGSKNGASVATIASEQIAAPIAKVVINFTQANASSTNALYLEVSANSDFSSVTKIEADIAVGSVEFPIATPAANQYYKITIDQAKGSANGFNRFDKVVFYQGDAAGEDVETVAAPEFSVTEANFKTAFTLDITSEEGTTLKYTIDNTDPSTSATAIEVATNSTTVQITKSTAVKAIAIKGELKSVTKSKVYCYVNSAETAYTVAEAMEVIDAGLGLANELYVKGEISEIEKFDANYGSITYWIKDEEGNKFECYSGLGLNKAKFTKKEDLVVGSKVVVCGVMKKYNTIYEFNYNNYIVSLELPVAKFNVTVTAENGTVEGAGEYIENAEVTLEATPAEGYEFTCWTSGEDTVSTENPYTFVVTADLALVANFNKKAEPEHTYTVAGAPATLFGTEWDPANTANDMNKQEDGTYKWEKTDVELATSSIQFKVAKNHAWTEAYPGDNYNLAITESGKYTITITFNAETKEVNAVATLQEVVEIIPTIAIAGDMNGWNTTANEFVMAEDKLTATLALTLEAKDYGFKMIIAGGWTSDAATITRENNSATFVNNGDNSTLAADVAGEYTFTWTYATNTLTVTYPVVSEPTYEVYEVEIKDLVIDYDNLVLSGSANDPFQVAVTLGLGEYNRNDDTYQLIPESYVELNGSGATFVEGYASVNGFDQTATAVVRCVWSGMNIELHLNMSSAPIEAIVVVVENATAMVEKVLLFGDMYDYALKITGEWINPEDGLTYPVLVEVPVYYPEATEPSEIMSTVTVGGSGDNDPWLGFGEGTLTITTVGDVVTATGVVQNPMAGVAIDITISGTIVTTDLDGVTVTAKPVKMIQNGQLIIIKNGVEYNAQGAQL